MKRYLVTTLAAAVLVAGILLVFVNRERHAVAEHAAAPAALFARGEALNAPAAAPDAVVPNLAPGAAGLEGSYSGAVQLDWVLQGTPGWAPQGTPGWVRTPTPAPTRTPGPSPTGPIPTATPALNLGEMELGLLLRSTGSSVSGYVDLAASQVFTVTNKIKVTPVPVGTVGPGYAPTPYVLEVGPKVVNSNFDGTWLWLEFEPVQEVTGTNLQLQRQIRLLGHRVVGSPGVFEGEYQETYWGFTKPGESVTLVGRFKLVQPSLVSGEPGASRLYLPLIRR